MARRLDARTSYRRASVLVFAALFAAGPALAQQSVGDTAGIGEKGTRPGFEPTPLPEPLTEDWGGARTALRDAGVEIGVGYKGETVANLSGGTSQRAVETGQLLIGVTLDLGKAAGLDGGTVRASVSRRHGPDLGEVAGLDTLQLPAEVFGSGRIWRYAELWYQQVLAGGHVVTRVGRSSAFDFASFDCEFTNLALCGAPPGNVAPDYVFVFPRTSWSGWVKVQSGGVHLKAGIREDNLNNDDRGFYLSRGGARGIILHGEVGWTPVFGAGRLAGRYRVGAWRTTAQGDDLLLGADRLPRSSATAPALQRRGPYGFYVQGQQHLSGSATEDPITGRITRKSGLDAFFNYVRTDPRTSRIIAQVNAGLYLNGPFPGRPDDHIGVGVARTRYNRRAAAADLSFQPLPGRRTAEIETEIYYALRAMPGLTLKPLVQHIVAPGGRRSARNALIAGLRVEADF